AVPKEIRPAALPQALWPVTESHGAGRQDCADDWTRKRDSANHRNSLSSRTRELADVGWRAGSREDRSDRRPRADDRTRTAEGPGAPAKFARRPIANGRHRCRHHVARHVRRTY